mmetsp:Transcript_45486/g.176933  ORF Transcript_45486/g.176933 Transcript_45486/m.176933 type:complete len:115 (+) Transcript_45486:1121-1465(+)
MPIKPVKWMAQTSMVVRSRLTCPSQGLRGQEHPPEEVVVAGEVALVVAAVVVMAVVEVALVTEAVVVEEEDAVVAVEVSLSLSAFFFLYLNRQPRFPGFVCALVRRVFAKVVVV